MATLQELIAQKEDLERQIEEATISGRKKAIEQIQALMAENGLTAGDLNGKTSGKPAGGRAKSSVAGSKVAAKFRNPSTGETWSGRGLQPRWLKAAVAEGRKAEEFSV